MTKTKQNMFSDAARSVSAIADEVYARTFTITYDALQPDGGYDEVSHDKSWEAGTRAAEPYDRLARAYWNAAIKAVR